MRTVFARHRSDQEKSLLHSWLQLATRLPISLGDVNRLEVGHPFIHLWTLRLTLYLPNPEGRRFFGLDAQPALVRRRFVTIKTPPDWVLVTRRFRWQVRDVDPAQQSEDFQRWSRELRETTDRLVQNIEGRRSATPPQPGETLRYDVLVDVPDQHNRFTKRLWRPGDPIEDAPEPGTFGR